MNARRSRLDRFVGKQLGISRDAVRLLLAQGRVRLDGQVVSDRALPVDGFQQISVDDQYLQYATAFYAMLHKPRGVLSATQDSRHPVAGDLIHAPSLPALHIVGRLDLHASGLLLLTNDGRWSRRLSAPQSAVIKQYEVTVQNPLHEDYIAPFQAGMHFAYENITTRPVRLEIVGSHTARVYLQEGRYHQIKRMFGRFRNPVLSIHRMAIGGLELDASLAVGGWRELREDEVALACMAKADCADGTAT